MYQPKHSDFLIHWTGKPDIDDLHDPTWFKKPSSPLNEKIIAPYLRRLRNILKYGLWMTKDPDEATLKIEEKSLRRPYVGRTCFTELRLSQARDHAIKFGRLGIGFKRPFLLNRLGAPMIYYHPRRKNWIFPPYLNRTLSKDKYYGDDYFSCFLKSMCGKEPGPEETWVFDHFDESEWRIFFSKEIEDRLIKEGRKDVVEKFRRVEEINDDEFKNDLERLVPEKRPDYVVPVDLDCWLAMIIYPNIAVKVEAERDDYIRDRLKEIKPVKTKDGVLLKSASYEVHNKPIEIDLDACRNF